MKLLAIFLLTTLLLAEPVTIRIGDCATCDISGMMDAGLSNDYPDRSVYGTDEEIRHRDLAGNASRLLYYFDLASIPVGAAVSEARLVYFGNLDYNTNFDSSSSKSIFKVISSGGSLWDESSVTLNDLTVGDSTYGAVYYKSWFTGGQHYFSTDVTELVQEWVNNPAENLGLIVGEDARNFNRSVYAKEASDPLYRPYLQVTFEGTADSVPHAPTSLKAVHSSGQTFLTWEEISSGKDETSYRIYRSDEPITPATIDDAELIDQVYQGSSYISTDIFGPGNLTQPDLSSIGVSLSANSGLYVATAEKYGSHYYAVTSVVEGQENRRTIESSSAVAETVAPPQAFLWERGTAGSLPYLGQVMWLSSFNPVDPSDRYGFTNRRSMPFFFSVVEPAGYSADNKYPLTLYLHAAGKNYFQSQEGYSPSKQFDEGSGGFSVGFSDFFTMGAKRADGELLWLGNYLITGSNRTTYGYSYYSGWNSNYQPNGYIDGFYTEFDVTKPYHHGVNVPYMEKFMAFIIDWMRYWSPWAETIDSNRVYARGGSMGGGGTHQLAIHYPEKIAAVETLKGRVKQFPEPASSSGLSEKVVKLMGSRSENIPMPDGSSVFDYFDLPKYLRENPSKEYPAMRIYHGKQDPVIPWNETPDFYEALKEAGVAHSGYWDQSDHNSSQLEQFPEFPQDGEYEWHYVRHAYTNPGYNFFKYALNRSFVGFQNSSFDQDMGTGLPSDGEESGGIHRFHYFDHHSIQESAESYSVDIYLLKEAPGSTGSADMIISRIQEMEHQSGTTYRWRMSDKAGNEIQTGTAEAKSNGTIFVPGLTMSKDTTTFTLNVDATAVVQESVSERSGRMRVSSQGNSITISPASSGTFTVSVTNLRGQQLLSKKGTGLTTVPLNSLGSGLYVVQVSSDIETVTRKFLLK